MEWIKVSNRLPENENWVLGCFGSGVQILPFWYRKGKWYQYDHAHNVNELITHWMHFPEPPKDE